MERIQKGLGDTSSRCASRSASTGKLISDDRLPRVFGFGEECLTVVATGRAAWRDRRAVKTNPSNQYKLEDYKVLQLGIDQPGWWFGHEKIRSSTRSREQADPTASVAPNGKHQCAGDRQRFSNDPFPLDARRGRQR
jgi:hypothetical protein